MNSPEKLSIVIPVYNEASTVSELLKQVWNVTLESNVQKEVIIVVSPSTDESEALVSAFLEQNKSENLKGIFQSKAQGKGQAVRDGFAQVTGTIILIQDADLEYDVNDYNELIKPILAKQTDLVIGSRHLSAGNWKIRKFTGQPIRAMILNLGGSIFHFLFNKIYGQKLSDPTTMYKIFRADYLKKFKLYSNRFDFDYELLAKLIRTGATPFELPVSYNSKDFEEGKKIRPFRDPLGWVWAIIKFRFSKLD